jgi:hypothetical protein
MAHPLLTWGARPHSTQSSGTAHPQEVLALAEGGPRRNPGTGSPTLPLPPEPAPPPGKAEAGAGPKTQKSYRTP